LQVPFTSGTSYNRTDTLTPGGAIHDETRATGSVVGGWAEAQCTGPIKASILYRYYDVHGIALSEAAVPSMINPATEFVTFAETNTGIAYANPSQVPASVTITALDVNGSALGSTVTTLPPNGHAADNVINWLKRNFTGSVQIISTAPIVSLSLNAEAFPSISSLPPGDLPDGTPLATGH
jgi:hypothetical protein